MFNVHSFLLPLNDFCPLDHDTLARVHFVQVVHTIRFIIIIISV